MTAPTPLALRPLGRTGLSVTRLGLGLAALGRPAYITLGRAEDFAARDEPAMRARAAEVLDAAWAAGVRYVDAARSYGRAEDFLAGWLGGRGVAPGAVAVSSKWGYAYVGGWRMDADVHERKEHSRSRFLEQRDESLGLLGPWLGLYQIHSLTPDSPAFGDARLLRELAALKGRGVAIGFSASGPAQGETIDRALALRVDGRPLFDAVQATWNLLEPSAGPALARAHAAGLGVVVKEPVANGRLTDRALAGSPQPWVAPLRRAAAEAGVGVDALALAAALANRWADSALSGAVTTGQLRANLAALALTPDAADAARALVPPEPATRYWAARAALPWS